MDKISLNTFKISLYTKNNNKQCAKHFQILKFVVYRINYNKITKII